MRAGFGKTEITPPARERPEMMGFGPFLGRTALEVVHPIHVRASYLEGDGGGAALLLAFDLCGLAEDLAEAIREAAGAAAGLDRDRVIASCTHTHSAPSVMPIIGWGEFHEPTAARLPKQAARAARAAKTSATAVSLEAGAACLDGFNRNRVYGPGGPRDIEVRTLAFRRAGSGELVGLWAHYSCHPVLLCERCRVISPDFCGVAMQALEEEHEGAVCSFVQGYCGDINPVWAHMRQERSLVHLAHAGYRFRLAVEEAMAGASERRGGHVGVLSEHVRLPVNVLSEEMVGAFTADADTGRRGEGWKRLAGMSARRLREEAKRLKGRGRPQRGAPAAALAVGEQTLVFHPFEMFTEIGLGIRERLGAEATWVVGYTNGYEGYAPTADRFTPTSGDYAAHGVPLMMGRHPYAADLGERLAEGLVRLGKRVR